MSGNYNSDFFAKSFGFLEDLRLQEKQEIKDQLRQSKQSLSERQRADLKGKLNRMVNMAKNI